MPRVVDVDVRRREIVDATARLIAKGGLAAATMRDIAAEAGWTTGVVSHYFTDKRDVLRQTLAHSIERRRATRPDLDGAPPAAHLRAQLAAALPLDEEGRRHWLVTLAFCSQADGDPELALVQRDAFREFRQHVTEQVQRCGASDETATEIAERLIAHVDGVALQAMFDPQCWPPQRQVASLDTLLATITRA